MTECPILYLWILSYVSRDQGVYKEMERGFNLLYEIETMSRSSRICGDTGNEYLEDLS